MSGYQDTGERLVTCWIALLAMFHAGDAYADGAFIRCSGSRGMAIYATGGVSKPGWTPVASENVVELWARKPNNFDIVQGVDGKMFSALDQKCQIGTRFSAETPMDMLVVSTCPSHVDTFSFYVRDGKHQLLATETWTDQSIAGVMEFESDCDLVRN